jgi:hypothetical protein
MKLEECTTREKLLRYLKESAPDTLPDAPFKDVVQKALDFGISATAWGDSLSLNSGTIGRWATGAITPHKVIQVVAIEKLKEFLASLHA